MQRPYFRHPAARGAGFRSPPPAVEQFGGRFPSPPWAFSPAPYGPRFSPYSGGSPDSSPRDSAGNRGGSSGKYHNRSPCHTPRRSAGNPSYRQSPGSHGSYQGSPRTSTPHGRERGNNMEKYYKTSMLQDPWINLQPISVTQTQSKCSTQQATHTGRAGRYYNKN